MTQKLQPVGSRRLAEDLLEHPVEVRQRLKTDLKSNFADMEVGVEQ